MKRRSFLLAGSALTALTSTAGAFGSSPPAVAAPSEIELEPTDIAIHVDKWATGTTLSAAPTIDGVISEVEWGEAAELGNFRYVFHDEAVPDGPSYRVGTTSTHLCLGGTAPLSDRADLAHIEVLVSTSSSGVTHFVVTIPVNAERPISTEWERSLTPKQVPSRIDVDTYEHAISDDIDLGRFGIELAVPFSAMPGFDPDQEWRINIVHIHNVDTLPMASWFPIRTSRYMDRTGEDVAFSSDCVNEGRLGSVMPAAAGGRLEGEGTWRLVYTGFTTKQVMWQTAPGGRVIPRGDAARSTLHLDWKRGERDWQRLTVVDATLDSESLSADFSHPEPLASGAYQLRVSTSTARSPESVLAILTFDQESMVRAGEEALGIEPDWLNLTPVAGAPASAEVVNLMDLVPERTGFRYVGLPENPGLQPDGLSIYGLAADGRSLTAKSTGTVYPNEEYPETETMTVNSRDGSEVDYPYHVDDEGRTYFISAHLWHLQKSFVRVKLPALAQRDPLGAARVLHRFAEAFQKWAPTADAVWYSHPMNFTAGPPFNYWGALWGRWWNDELITLRSVVLTYGEVKKTNAFDVLSAEMGVDVEDLVVNEMIVPSVAHVGSAPFSLNNQTAQIIRGLTAVGRNLRRPDYVHQAVAGLNDMGIHRFMADGSWYEIAPSYHRETIGMLRVAFDELDGYSDPEGYVSPRTGKRYDNLDVSDQFPVLAKADRLANILAFPSGKILPAQDTWAADVVPDPDTESGSVLLPSAGIARLVAGAGTDQSQVYLEFTSKYGHGHYDPLTISFHDGQRELLTDVGYTYTRYRYSTLSTIGHNTVTVDSQDALITGEAVSGGTIERMHSTADDLLQIVRADQRIAYDITERYARELWMISLGDGASYILDLFRVSGGTRHEYALGGDAMRDSSFDTWLETTPYGDRLLPAGVTAVEALSEKEKGSAGGHYPGYIYVKKVLNVDLDDRAGYDLTIIPDDDDPQSRLAIMGSLESGSNSLFLGRSPALRNTRQDGKSRDLNDEDNLAFTLPRMVHRREGSNLHSTFVTAIESYGLAEGRRVEAVDRLPIESGPSTSVAAKVCHGSTTDLVISNPYAPTESVTVAGVTMTGEGGLVRLVNGEISQIRLIGGTRITIGDVELIGAGIVTGQVIGTRRAAAGDDQDALVVDIDVPVDAVGCFVTTTQPDGSSKAFRVGEVISETPESILVLSEEDPGFIFNNDGSSEQTSYPEFRWPSGGTHTFSIALTAHWDGPATPYMTSAGVIQGIVLDPDSEPLAGATVRVAGDCSLSIVSGADGTFTLAGVPVGSNRVVAVKDGWAPAVSEPVTVVADAVAEVNVQVRGEVPPMLVDVDSLVGVGDPIRAVVSLPGQAVLVPLGTEADVATIAALVDSGAGVSVPVATAGDSVEIPTGGLSAGYYQVHAIDERDLMSGPFAVQLLATGDRMIDDADPSLWYTGTWHPISSTSQAIHDGGYRYANTAAASVTIPFHGTSAVIRAHTNPSGGLADVYLDDEFVAEIDYYRSSQLLPAYVFESGELPRGVHTVKIVSKGVASTPAATNRQVRLDVLEVTG